MQWSRGAFAAAARSRWPPTWRCELGMAKMRFPPLLVAILDPYAWEESCRSCRSREILPVALEEVGQRVRRGDMEESMRNVLVV